MRSGGEVRWRGWRRWSGCDADKGVPGEENMNTNTWGNGRMNKGVTGTKYGEFLMN